MRPRMYGSTDMNTLRTTISPSAGSATSTSASSKSDGCGSPTGRAASLTSRLIIDGNASPHSSSSSLRVPAHEHVDAARLAEHQREVEAPGSLTSRFDHGGARFEQVVGAHANPRSGLPTMLARAYSYS